MLSESMQVDHISMDDVPGSEVNNTTNELVVGNIPIDLASYISNYTGYIRYQRLFFIAHKCPSLWAEALRLAHDYIKNFTMDTGSYNHIFTLLIMQASSSIRNQDGSVAPSGEIANDGFSSSSNSFDELQSQDGHLTSEWENGAANAPPLDPAHKLLRSAVLSGQNEAKLVYDASWVESMRRKGAIRLEQLDTDLKNYKANSIKESIRRGSDDLGDLYLQIGQLRNAIKCYTRSRDYCTSQHQELIMCLNVIKVAIFQRAWPHVSAHVIRAENLSEVRDSALAAAAVASNTAGIGGSPSSSLNLNKRSGFRPNNSSSSSGRSATGFGLGLMPPPPSPGGAGINLPSTAGTGSIASAFSAAGCGQTYRDAMAQARTQLAIAGGLVELATSNYRGAANYFLTANYDHLESPGRHTLVTPSDLAYYITLCCLATFDRPELARRVISNPNFRLLLEAEPICREVLTAFHVQADYATCLQLLNSVKGLLQLDIFLASHVRLLCSEIRSRAICQYFSPYSTADLNRMALAFNTSVSNLENELAELIQNGHIKARIDSHKQLLRALNVDERCSTFAKVLRLAENYKKQSQAMVLRMSLARHKLVVQSNRSEPDSMVNFYS